LIKCILILPYTIYAYEILYKNKIITENDQVIKKRSESSVECKYINSLLKQNESYDCCIHYGGGVVCENGHITKL